MVILGVEYDHCRVRSFEDVVISGSEDLVVAVVLIPETRVAAAGCCRTLWSLESLLR